MFGFAFGIGNFDGIFSGNFSETLYQVDFIFLKRYCTPLLICSAIPRLLAIISLKSVCIRLLLCRIVRRVM